MTATRSESRRPSATDGAQARRGATRLLSLAAAPTFVLMAMATDLFGHGAADMLCSGEQDRFALSGMVPMYVLMGIFHMGPWLTLLSRPTWLTSPAGALDGKNSSLHAETASGDASLGLAGH